MNIIIDANVASSAGNNPMVAVSIISRDTLSIISDNNHDILFCSKLKCEWDAHISNFSSSWLRVMVAKRKVKFVNPSKTDVLQYILDNIPVKNNHHDSLKKDAHLVDLALDTCKTVISNEKKCKKHFDIHSSDDKCPILREVVWLNPNYPENHHIEVLAILKGDDVVKDKHYIGYRS